MSEHKWYLAIDLGAESGRIMLGEWADEQVLLKEIYRFANGPLEQEGSLRWDIDQILHHVKLGIGRAAAETEGTIRSMAVDSWGVDFGWLDADGGLLENPYHYRDERTKGIFEKAFGIMPKKEIYQNSGLQFMEINTLYQLLAFRETYPELFRQAKRFLLIADLVSYLLGGGVYAEYTLASTSQLMDMREGQWSRAIFEAFEIPPDMAPEIVGPGVEVGVLREQICRELGIETIQIVAGASHDTAGAVAAVPARGDKWAYISSGTWSLVGVETDQAIINEESLDFGFTNEGGVGNTIRYLKNLAGLWPLQQCKKYWQKGGENLSYETLTGLARRAQPFAGRLDLNHESFFSPGAMPEKINAYLKETGQREISDRGQMVRVILESLVRQYQSVIEVLERIRKTTIEVIHMVGGGSRNELLCQLTADATGKEVVAGPVEATAMGNIMIQALVDGQITSLYQGRDIIRGSVPLKKYYPGDSDLWSEHYCPKENSPF